MLGANSPLTDTGRAQAENVAERMKHVAFDVLISSTYPRALDTARAIGVSTNKPVVKSDLFYERTWPSTTLGLHYQDQKKREVEKAMFDSYARGETEYRVADEETYSDLLLRAQAARDYLESRPESSIVVVTHGTFLRFLHAVLQLGDQLTPQLYRNLHGGHGTYNTGVTLYEVDGEQAGMSSAKWKLRTWMDVAHLAE